MILTLFNKTVLDSKDIFEQIINKREKVLGAPYGAVHSL